MAATPSKRGPRSSTTRSQSAPAPFTAHKAGGTRARQNGLGRGARFLWHCRRSGDRFTSNVSWPPEQICFAEGRNTPGSPAGGRQFPGRRCLDHGPHEALASIAARDRRVKASQVLSLSSTTAWYALARSNLRPSPSMKLWCTAMTFAASVRSGRRS
eukprot:scaffold98044_cov72-Phaeocystis_antarctica.AAC.3